MKKMIIKSEKNIDFFNKIERKYPVSKWRVKEVDIWPYLRMVLGFSVLNISRPATSREPEENSLGQLPKLSSLIMKNKKVDIFILMDSISRIRLNRKWYSRLSSPFIEPLKSMGMHSVNLEFSHHNIERYPVFEESYSITNQIEYVRNNYYLEKVVELEKYDEVRKEFIANYGENFDFPTIGSVNTAALYIQRMSCIFATLFLEKKTKVAITTNYYDPNSYALILAAKRVGIPSVDIQHGNQRDLFYHRWLNIPIEGYNIFPNVFVCWEEQNVDDINDWADKTNRHKAIIGGNPWINMWKDISHPIVKKYENVTKKFIDTEKVNILLTLQPLYGLPDWNENIPEWVVNAIKVSPENWKWHIRYHHAMLGNYHNEKRECEKVLAPYIVSGKVETKNATREPLLAILRKMTIHITPYSTCVIEAMHLQIPSIAIHDRAKEYFKNEFASGWISKADNTGKLIAQIQELISKKNMNDLPPVYIENIGSSKWIDEILNSQEKNTYNSNEMMLSQIRKEIYLADDMYVQILEEFEKESLHNNFMVGKAFEKLGETKKAIKYFEMYMNELFNNPNKIKVNINDILHLKEFYTNKNYVQEVEVLNNYIGLLINKEERLKSIFFKTLFQSRRFHEVKEWKDKVEKSIDTNFFIGRSLLAMGEMKEGISVLQEYLKMTTQQNRHVYEQTRQRNYIASAYFYLGETSIHMNKIEDAIYYLEQCNLLTNGQHGKAKAYLKMLER